MVTCHMLKRRLRCSLRTGPQQPGSTSVLLQPCFSIHMLWLHFQPAACVAACDAGESSNICCELGSTCLDGSLSAATYHIKGCLPCLRGQRPHCDALCLIRKEAAHNPSTSQSSVH